jgi:hypothetical protein
MANCLRGIYPYINRGIIFQGPGIFFKLARCGYTLRVTSQTSYSPEYTTPTQQIVNGPFSDNTFQGGIFTEVYPRNVYLENAKIKWNSAAYSRM